MAPRVTMPRRSTLVLVLVLANLSLILFSLYLWHMSATGSSAAHASHLRPGWSPPSESPATRATAYTPRPTNVIFFPVATIVAFPISSPRLRITAMPTLAPVASKSSRSIETAPLPVSRLPALADEPRSYTLHKDLAADAVSSCLVLCLGPAPLLGAGICRPLDPLDITSGVSDECACLSAPSAAMAAAESCIRHMCVGTQTIPTPWTHAGIPRAVTVTSTMTNTVTRRLQVTAGGTVIHLPIALANITTVAPMTAAAVIAIATPTPAWQDPGQFASHLSMAKMLYPSYCTSKYGGAIVESAKSREATDTARSPAWEVGLLSIIP